MSRVLARLPVDYFNLKDAWRRIATTVNGLVDAFRDVEGVITYGAEITFNAGDGTPHGDLNATDFTGHDRAVGTALKIETNAIVTFGHNLIAYIWEGPSGVTVGLGGSYTAVSSDLVPIGTGDHAILSNRDQADQHPTLSITGLDTKQAEQDVAINTNATNIQTNTDNHAAHVNPANTSAHEMSNISGLILDQERQDNAIVAEHLEKDLPSAAYDFSDAWWSTDEPGAWWYGEVLASQFINPPWPWPSPPFTTYNIWATKQVKTDLPTSIINLIRVASTDQWGSWEEVWMRTGANAAGLVAADWVRVWSDRNHGAGGDPHPQYSARGYGGIYRATPTVAIGDLMTVPTLIGASAYDSVLSSNPVGVTQNLAGGSLSVQEAGLWLLSISAIGEITPVTANASNTIALAVYDVANGVVGDQPSYFTVPRYGETFSIALTVPIAIDAARLNLDFGLAIWQLFPTPQITVEVLTAIDLHLVKFASAAAL